MVLFADGKAHKSEATVLDLQDSKANSSESKQDDAISLISRLTTDAPTVQKGDSVRIGGFQAKIGDKLCDMEDSTHQELATGAL